MTFRPIKLDLKRNNSMLPQDDLMQVNKSITSHKQVPLWHSPWPEQLSFPQLLFQAIIPNLTNKDNGFCVLSAITCSMIARYRATAPVQPSRKLCFEMQITYYSDTPRTTHSINMQINRQKFLTFLEIT